jgi:hypothetical protein
MSEGTSNPGEEIHIYSKAVNSIAAIPELYLHPLGICSINLHNNCISQIDSLSPLANLRYLDLSSNEITCIEGLQTLVLLESLNLAANQINRVQGLGNLHKLRHLNLAFNRITDLSGLVELRGSHFAIEFIDLRGNIIRTLRELDNFRDLVHLQHLLLSADGRTNPICDQNRVAYRDHIFSVCPNLRSLDRLDKYDQSVGSLPSLRTGSVITKGSVLNIQLSCESDNVRLRVNLTNFLNLISQ